MRCLGKRSVAGVLQREVTQRQSVRPRRRGDADNCRHIQVEANFAKLLLSLRVAVAQHDLLAHGGTHHGCDAIADSEGQQDRVPPHTRRPTSTSSASPAPRVLTIGTVVRRLHPDYRAPRQPHLHPSPTSPRQTHAAVPLSTLSPHRLASFTNELLIEMSEHERSGDPKIGDRPSRLQ